MTFLCVIISRLLTYYLIYVDNKKPVLKPLWAILYSRWQTIGLYDMYVFPMLQLARWICYIYLHVNASDFVKFYTYHVLYITNVSIVLSYLNKYLKYYLCKVHMLFLLNSLIDRIAVHP